VARKRQQAGRTPNTVTPAVEDGVYLLLAPLSAGQHTIHFTVAGFLDITYHLNVK